MVLGRRSQNLFSVVSGFQLRGDLGSILTGSVIWLLTIFVILASAQIIAIEGMTVDPAIPLYVYFYALMGGLVYVFATLSGQPSISIENTQTIKERYEELEAKELLEERFPREYKQLEKLSLEAIENQQYLSGVVAVAMYLPAAVLL